MSHVMTEFLVCLNRQSTYSVVKACVQSLTRICQQKKVRAVKIIRASMQEMHTLLYSDPSVKVIHLLRDPRAALRSQNSVGEFKWQNIRQAASKICTRVWDDLQMARVLWRRFPGRILTLRYEDIVASPLEVTQQMYDFVGIDFTLDIRKFVWNSTYGGLPDDCNICTTRTNATATAYKWRTEPERIPQILLAQSECTNVMKVGGYKVLSTKEEILDQSIPSTLE
ncbi:carbohydrate sulfotransferase 1-like [Elysia marginata]|uniref:Carbohydrate sulfotransferase 1-like n=1 Tax=Elysia marginata TaxID=1093978 RepID=A0AAV4ICM3_9GAST|nr:carbohydrate sulfotransferase 1-like [Elysia marginata]